MSSFFTNELLQEIRERFIYLDWDPYTGKRIHFEASGGSVRLKSVVEAVAKETALPDEHNRGNPGSRHADEVLRRVIEDAMIFVGAHSGAIMPALSGTQACFRLANAILGAVSGTNIVTTRIEHPCVIGAATFFGDRMGLEVRYADISRDTSSVHVDEIVRHIDKDTCLLAFNHASNITGAVHDIRGIVTEARRINPDLFIISDGVQYTPHGPMNVEEWGIDGYFFSPYKAYSVKGIGFGWLSERASRLPHWKLPAKPEADWIIGSPGHQMYAAFTAMIDYLCWLGGHFTDSRDRRTLVATAKERIHQSVVALLNRVVNGSEKVKGLRAMPHVQLPKLGDLSSRLCIVPFNIRDLEPAEAMKRYADEFGIRVCARVQDAYSKGILDALRLPHALRLSGCHYNSPEEVDAFLQATASMG